MGPTLWIVVMQGWFRKIKTETIRYMEAREGSEALADVQAFADDQIIIITGRSVKQIEHKSMSRLGKRELCTI